MTANRNNILAGVAGGGAGSSLAHFAKKGSVLPTAAVGVGATLDPAFKDGGWISEEGLRKGVNESNTDLMAFGTTVPVRVFNTSSKVTFQLTFLESNPVAVAVYNRKALDAIVVDPLDGSFTFNEGAHGVQEYAAVFDIVDGVNHLRAVVGACEVTDRTEVTMRAGEAIRYGVTMTAYPDANGIAVRWYYVVDALKTAP